jgi:hypothetical protein
MRLLLVFTLAALAQQSSPTPAQEAKAMLVGVSRDDSMFKGGIGSSKWTGKGMVVVEPLAQITPSGKWVSLPCNSRRTRPCTEFADMYLGKAHTYKVVSADGNGATIQAAPVKLSECFGYDGVGTYAGVTISESAIAASSTDFFADGGSPQPLDEKAAAPIRKALALLVPKKLDSIANLRLFSLEIEGQKLILVQRAFADFAGVPEHEGLGLIFAIGTFHQGNFSVIRWKQNTEDEQEACAWNGPFEERPGLSYHCSE